jgi:Tol biopolymer transport system component
MVKAWSGGWARALLVVAAAMSGVCAARAQAFTPDLLFHSLRHGPSQIYLADSSSGESRRLRDSGDEDIDASWSPDGKRLLFTGRKLTNSEVFVADADGGRLKQLTDHPGYDGAARWSPDGKTIAFLSSRSGEAKVYLMDADGGRLRRLTDLAEGEETNHSWSPDGKRIAFVNVVKRRLSVWTSPVDGGAPARASAENVNETNPAWSPDGTEVAFIRTTRTDAQLRVVKLATGSQRELAASLSRKSNPMFSSDGRQILFEGVDSTSPGSEIFSVPSAGGEVVNLTNDPAEDTGADLSLDGRRLVFVSYRNGPVGQIYWLDMATRSLKRITNTSHHEFRPVWRPLAPGA